MSQNCINEPHVSNSLMAAIKRSQANQRRYPDVFLGVKHHQDQNFGCITSSSSSSLNVVQVDLPHLIVAILDDPIVSRVFNDAGFNSFDVKLAILRPFYGLFKYPDPGQGPGMWRFRIPNSGSWDEDSDYRRIVEVLRRKKGSNPLLIGVCANDVLKGFVEVLTRKNEGYLPFDMFGINVISIENDVVKFVNENSSFDEINLWFREVKLMVDQCLGHGLVVNVGKLRCFLGKSEGYEMDMVNLVVRKLTKLLEIHSGKVWLTGSAASDQIYMDFISRFPLIDKNWDLQPLAIASVEHSKGDSWFKSSLMGSFVPFGGFFSSPSDLKCPSNNSIPTSTPYCCNIHNGKFEQDISGYSKGGTTASVADTGVLSTMDRLKANCSSMWLSVTAASLQIKQDEKCQCHQNQPSLKPESSKPPTKAGFQCVEQRPKTVNVDGSCSTSFLCGEFEYAKINSCLTMDVKQLHYQSSKPVLQTSAINNNLPPRLLRSASKTEHLRPSDSVYAFSEVEDGQSSPASQVSVATDLGLDIYSQAGMQRKIADTNVYDDFHVANSSKDVSLNFDNQTASNFKALFKALLHRVGRQSEALTVVSLVVAQSWTSNKRHLRSLHRGDIWLNFIGPDVLGERKTAFALAETLYGSKEYVIHIDLCSEDVTLQHQKIFGYQITSGYNARSRGKTFVDHIAEELRKTPYSVVLLENAESADPVAQSNLLQAIRTGKFSDSFGREVPLTNRIFVLTAALPVEEHVNLIEGRMTRVKSWPLQIVVKDAGDYTLQHNFDPGKNTLSQNFASKRKINGLHATGEQCVDMDLVKRPRGRMSMSLDLNMPAVLPEADDTNHKDTDRLYECKNAVPWLEESSDQVIDKMLVKVLFDPFDYDALAKRVLKLVNECLYKVTNSKCLLEIEPKAMDQITAAACLSDSDKEIVDWIDYVLGNAFAETQNMHQLTDYSVVVLSTCECEVLRSEDIVTGFRLPSKIRVT